MTAPKPSKWNSSGVEMLYGRLPTTRSDRAALRERAEVEAQRVDRVDHEPLGVRDSGRQRRRELAVDLDDVQPLESLDERGRQRPGAAADLDHEVGRLAGESCRSACG